MCFQLERFVALSVFSVLVLHYWVSVADHGHGFLTLLPQCTENRHNSVVELTPWVL